MEYFSLTKWQYGNLVLVFAFLFSMFTVYVMRNIDKLGFKKEIPWLAGRIIVVTAILLGAWLGGCIEYSFQREKETLSLLLQMKYLL